VITNGVFQKEDDDIHVSRRNFALALGRICPEKNFHVALDAGTQAGVPVWIGGKVYPYPEHEIYFRQEIMPQLRHGNRFLGPLTAQRKMQLLATAKCLLVPSLAPETSSLVAMEACSVGTPVIAFPSGALPGNCSGWCDRLLSRGPAGNGRSNPPRPQYFSATVLSGSQRKIFPWTNDQGISFSLRGPHPAAETALRHQITRSNSRIITIRRINPMPPLG
jgi:hypothetical protein